MTQSSGAQGDERERWIAAGRALAKIDRVVFEALIDAMRGKLARIRTPIRPLITFPDIPS